MTPTARSSDSSPSRWHLPAFWGREGWRESPRQQLSWLSSPFLRVSRATGTRAQACGWTRVSSGVASDRRHGSGKSSSGTGLCYLVRGMNTVRMPVRAPCSTHPVSSLLGTAQASLLQPACPGLVPTLLSPPTFRTPALARHGSPQGCALLQGVVWATGRPSQGPAAGLPRRAPSCPCP